jgi:Flp pilus assembly protein TadG
MPGRASCQRGSALVEFALSVTIMATLLFGTMAISMALYSYHFIAEAAREGSRYAMVRGTGCTSYSGFTSACPATSAQIQTYVRSLSFPGINPNNMSVTAAYAAYPAGGTCTPSSACNNPGNQVTVTVSYQLPVSIPFVPARTLTMTSRSQMVIAD